MNKLLKNALGYEFNSMALLQQALTHRSLAKEPQQSYERLEFLGDRILGYIIADLLLEAFPEEQEGSLSKRHADLVRRETLAEIACQAGIGAHIHMSRGEADAGGRNNQAILSDICESLIAAIYRDGGRLFVLCCQRLPGRTRHRNFGYDGRGKASESNY